MKGNRSAFIYFWYQTNSELPNTCIYSAVSLAPPNNNFKTAHIDWSFCCHRSPVRYIPSKSCDLADENNKILMEWKWFEQPYWLCQIFHASAGLIKRSMLYKYVSLRSEFCVVMSFTISTQKRCSVRLYLQLFVGGLMSYLCNLLADENNEILKEWKWF
jgi:hypothetical protein